MMKRYVAIKSKISDIMDYENEKKEDEIGKYLQIGEVKVRRVHIVGIVNSPYFNSEKQLAFFKITSFKHTTLKENDDEISVRFFKDGIKYAQNINDGALVRVIGKVKEFDGERYVLGEIIKEITPLEAELFRADIINLGRKPIKDKINDQNTINVKDDVFKYIKKNSGDGANGIKYITLSSVFCETENDGNISKDSLDKILNDLLIEGMIFEPKIGRFKEI